jgi:hypothetical protein
LLPGFRFIARNPDAIATPARTVSRFGQAGLPGAAPLFPPGDLPAPLGLRTDQELG